MAGQVINSYDINQAEEDIGALRGQTALFDEVMSQATEWPSGGQPNTPTTGYSMYASTGQQKYVGSDGSAYNTGSLRQIISTRGTTINSTSGILFPGWSAAVNIGTYIVTGKFWITTNAAAGQPGIFLTGPTISQWDFMGESRQQNTTSTANTNAWVGANTVNSAGYNVASQNITAAMAGTANFICDFAAWLVFTATGTLQMKGLTSIAADTWTLQSGFWEVKPVT